ncbi:MAG: 4'-phosphopantetheinyl transferase superfamily protein, partial [Gammaproteobacteria bacterium]
MKKNIIWQNIPSAFETQAGNIHLLRLVIPEMVSQYDVFWKILTLEEQARAERFKFDEDRVRCVLARGGLRYILSRFISKEPDLIYFDSTRYGKLFLPEEENNLDLEFNIS